MDMNLKSFPAWAELYNTIELHKAALQSVVEVNQTKLADLQTEYADNLLKGASVEKIGKAMKPVKDDIKHAKEELEFVAASDLRLPHLAEAVHQEFLTVSREVRNQIEELYQQSQQIKDDAIASIKSLREAAEELSAKFGTEVVDAQFLPVIDCMDLPEDDKNGLRFHGRHAIGSSNWVMIDGRHN